jgi:hypothetical protein
MRSDLPVKQSKHLSRFLSPAWFAAGFILIMLGVIAVYFPSIYSLAALAFAILLFALFV